MTVRTNITGGTLSVSRYSGLSIYIIRRERLTLFIHTSKLKFLK
jgi:hypothetical protein